MTLKERDDEPRDERWDEPARPIRKHRPHDVPPPAELVHVDLANDLPGSIYEVPDTIWGISSPGRDWHPGLCVASDNRTDEAILIKGTSQPIPSGLRSYFILEPTDANGLKHPTAFNLVEMRRFRRQKIALLHMGRLLGRIETAQLIHMQEELMYILANEARDSAVM